MEKGAIMGQTSYARNITKRRAGAAADYQALDTADIVTCRNEDSVAVFPGRFVVSGTNTSVQPHDCKIQDSGAAIGAGFYIGLATENTNRERVQGSTATDGYIENAMVPVARTGRFFVETEETVVKGGTVFVRYVAGAGGSIIGKARTDVDTASAEAVNATFAESVTGAGLAAIDLNMPQV